LIINGHSVPIGKLNKAYTYQIEFTPSQRGKKLMPAQRETTLAILLLKLSVKE